MGIGDFVGDFVDGAKNIVSDPIGAVAGVFDIGEPTGNDHESSNWAAWGHAEIRDMLDTTVEPADIDDAARAWRDLQENAKDIITRATAELRGIVSDGWRGESADAAIRSLKPVDDWADSVSAAMDHTASLMDSSGSAAGQAKATVPPAQSHNWGRSLGSFALAGGAGAFVDAVAQDRAQEAARAEAVRIMTTVYSAPINENRAAVPVYPQLADPTLQPPEHAPIVGPSPGAGHGGAGALGAGGGVPGGGVAGQPPATAGLQAGAGRSGLPESGQSVAGQLAGPNQPISSPDGRDPGGRAPGGRASGGGVPGLGGAPLTAPMGGPGAAGEMDRARRGFRGTGFGGGRAGGLGGAGGRGGGGFRGGPSFGPRGSGGGAAGVGEGRVGAGPSGGAGAAGRGGVGGAPLIGTGTGRGRGEDTEHHRPSYLIEMDDVFNDGRKVAPPVIGEDPPEYYG